MLSDVTTPMGRGASLGLALAVAAMLAAVTGVHAVGAALGYCVGQGGGGWFTALVIVLAVAAGHAA